MADSQNDRILVARPKTGSRIKPVTANPPHKPGVLSGAHRVLMVFAHADDETLLAGALIAKLVSVGYQVKVVCLAPGSAERLQRLQNACDVLGVSAIETLRYAEGEMWPDDTVSNETTMVPILATAPVGDLAGRISGRISEYNPDLVITHSRYGDYGHADHAATYQATVRAFQESANKASRLYALAWPKFLVAVNSRLMKIGGRDIRRMGPNGQFDLPAAIRASFGVDGVDEADSGSDLTIDVADMLGVRRRASRWYALEISRGPLPLRALERLPIWLQRTVLGRARLTLLRAPVGFSPTAPRHSESSAGGSSSAEYL